MVLRHGTGRVLTSPDHAGADPVQRRPWSVLVLLCVAQFMVVLDMTVVNIALPSIGRTLRFDPSDLEWVVTTYLLTTGMLTLAGGRASDLFGRRRMFLAGGVLTTWFGWRFTAGGAGLAAGYRHAMLAAAVVAAGLAVLAVRAVPSVRPAAGAKVAVH